MEIGEPAAARGRGDPDRGALARPGARRRRPAARADRRGLRARVLGQDDARLPRDRRGPAARRALRLHRRRARDGSRLRERRSASTSRACCSAQPDYGEQALEVADLLVRSGEVALIVIDSVAALVPKAELEATMDEQQVGLQARMMSKGLRKLAGHLREAGTTCLFTNQLRERVGVVYGPRETQPGGRALKFYASQRLDLRRIETLKEGERAVGICVRAKVVKNKVAGALRRGRVRDRLRARDLAGRMRARPGGAGGRGEALRAPTSPTARSGSGRGGRRRRRRWRSGRSWSRRSPASCGPKSKGRLSPSRQSPTLRQRRPRATGGSRRSRLPRPEGAGAGGRRSLVLPARLPAGGRLAVRGHRRFGRAAARGGAG